MSPSEIREILQEDPQKKIMVLVGAQVDPTAMAEVSGNSRVVVHDVAGKTAASNGLSITRKKTAYVVLVGGMFDQSLLGAVLRVAERENIPTSGYTPWNPAVAVSFLKNATCDLLPATERGVSSPRRGTRWLRFPKRRGKRQGELGVKRLGRTRSKKHDASRGTTLQDFVRTEADFSVSDRGAEIDRLFELAHSRGISTTRGSVATTLSKCRRMGAKGALAHVQVPRYALARFIARNADLSNNPRGEIDRLFRLAKEEGLSTTRHSVAKALLRHRRQAACDDGKPNGSSASAFDALEISETLRERIRLLCRENAELREEHERLARRTEEVEGILLKFREELNRTALRIDKSRNAALPRDKKVRNRRV